MLGRILSFKFEVSSVDNLSLISPDEIIVIPSALETFQQSDIEILQQHRQQGGSIFIMITSATAKKASQDMMGFLSKIGVNLIKYDAVIQQTYTPGLYHPTHVAINQQAFLNAALATKIDKIKQQQEIATDLQIVYPNGCYF